jgi:hypothetical protein
MPRGRHRGPGLTFAQIIGYVIILGVAVAALLWFMSEVK